MKKCHKYRKMMVDAAFHELAEDQENEFFQHLDSCQKCRNEFSQMQETLTAMNQWQRPEHDEEFWRSYWTELERKIELESKESRSLKKSDKKVFVDFFAWPRLLPQAAAAIVILLIGIYIGKALFQNANENLPVEMGSLNSTFYKPELISARQYLEKSKIILMGLINFDAKQDDPFGLDFPYQKKISQNLAFEANYLKSELADSGYAVLADLIGQLQIIMLQIANLEEENDLPGIELITAGVKEKGILLKISLQEIELSDTEQEKAVPKQKADEI